VSVWSDDGSFQCLSGVASVQLNLPCNKPCAIYAEGFVSRTSGKRKPTKNRQSQFEQENAIKTNMAEIFVVILLSPGTH